MANQSEDDIPTVGLDAVLMSLSADLRAAQASAAEKGAYGLEVNEATIELSVTVEQSRTGEANAGVKWSVLALGGRKARQDTDKRIHQITLKLAHPVAAGGPSLPPPVSGSEEDTQGPEDGPKNGRPGDGASPAQAAEAAAPGRKTAVSAQARRVPTHSSIVVSATEVADLLWKMGLPRDRSEELADEIREEAMASLKERGARRGARKASAKKATARTTKKAAAKKSAPAKKSAGH
ncbi:trypco2 family protein [Streptomyces lydicus]